MRPFRHSDAGQMNFYLNYWKAHGIGEGDNPPVGLILCSERSATRAQYATAGIDQQMFVSRYLTALPSVERLQKWVDEDREAIEAAKGMEQVRDAGAGECGRGVGYLVN